MNNGATETAQPNLHSRGSHARNAPSDDEFTRVKSDLLKAEVRLAKARATIVTAEIDVRVLSARLKALAK
jgi:hypothetical protein